MITTHNITWKIVSGAMGNYVNAPTADIACMKFASFYGLTKIETEKDLRAYCESSGIRLELSYLDDGSFVLHKSSP